MLHQDLTKIIIGTFFEVHNKLKFGFLEKVYENTLIYELRKRGLHCEQQKKLEVIYDGIKMGEYYADICVEGLIIIELKAAKELVYEHEVQLLNYLHASKMEVGLLLNFGISGEIRRKECLNKYKPLLMSR